ncbi:MAG: polyprenyl synthetase family protein [Bdellovibrionales bacterium]|nr:polyprenyl synthetase family protein [Bdellovibrionales bacterium]
MGIGDQIRLFPGMKEVEELIRSKFSSDARLLREIPEYLLDLGGKRVRPALTLITAKMCGLPNLPQELLDVSAGIELIHMATLLHDDIIDRSPVRRGKTAPHLKFGEPATLLTGDFLLVRAFSLCAHLDNFIVSETEEACVYLTEGEILELPLSKQPCSVSESLTIAEKKTAALFGLAAVSGAHVAEAGDETEFALKRFGIELGIAFQILDDVLDVVADENLLGKRCGGDLVEQKPSLVNVLWLKSGSQEATEVLLSETPPTEAQVSSALQQLRSGADSRIIEEARAIADEKIAQANAALEQAVNSLRASSRLDEPSHQLLAGLIDYTVKRLR